MVVSGSLLNTSFILGCEVNASLASHATSNSSFIHRAVSVNSPLASLPPPNLNVVNSAVEVVLCVASHAQSKS